MQERRKLLRVPAPVSLTCRTAQPPHEEHTVCKDVCEGGLRFTTAVALMVGSPVELELVLPFDSLPLAMKGRVAWVRERSPMAGSQFDVGIRFTEMSGADRQRLVAYVQRFLQQQSQPPSAAPPPAA